ncbi:MAG: hypothetical protein WBM09_02010 [Gallionella sp.]
MNNPGSMPNSEQDIVEHKVRRAAGANALRKIALIVATERQADAGKARWLRWFARYGWIALPGAVLLAAYLIVKI